MKPTKEQLLENFMKEFFDFESLLKCGFFTKEMRGDYKAQADKVCKFFGYKTVYEYRAKEVRMHISYAKGHRPKYVNESGELVEEPFITVIKSIYEQKG